MQGHDHLCLNFTLRTNQHRVRSAWHIWHACVQLRRIDTVRTAQSLRDAWNTWWVKYAERAVVRRGKLEKSQSFENARQLRKGPQKLFADNAAAVMTISSRVDLRVMRNSWVLWRSRTNAWLHQSHAAASTCHWRRMHAAWHKWLRRRADVQEGDALAISFWQNQRLRLALRTWLRVMEQRRLARQIYKQRHRKVTQIWDRKCYLGSSLFWSAANTAQNGVLLLHNEGMPTHVRR